MWAMSYTYYTMTFKYGLVSAKITIREEALYGQQGGFLPAVPFHRAVLETCHGDLRV